jgi:predicted SnoaL-like aldol condensation-catalyzing enzyme
MIHKPTMSDRGLIALHTDYFDNFINTKMKRFYLIFAILLTVSFQNVICQENNCEIAAKNKKIVVEFYQRLFGDKDISAIDQYIAEDYIQHNPIAADGRQALKEFAKTWIVSQPKTQVDFQKVVADGDLVVLHIKTKSGTGKLMSLVDIFRLKDGKITEHWDIMQEVPEKSANPHPMF